MTCGMHKNLHIARYMVWAGESIPSIQKSKSSILNSSSSDSLGTADQEDANAWRRINHIA
jgi:hypothetical protein